MVVTAPSVASVMESLHDPGGEMDDSDDDVVVMASLNVVGVGLGVIGPLGSCPTGGLPGFIQAPARSVPLPASTTRLHADCESVEPAVQPCGHTPVPQVVRSAKRPQPVGVNPTAGSPLSARPAAMTVDVGAEAPRAKRARTGWQGACAPPASSESSGDPVAGKPPKLSTLRGDGAGGPGGAQRGFISKSVSTRVS